MGGIKGGRLLSLNRLDEQQRIQSAGGAFNKADKANSQQLGWLKAVKPEASLIKLPVGNPPALATLRFAASALPSSSLDN
jgi:hypothetical protein